MPTNILLMCLNWHMYTLYTLITTFQYLFCLRCRRSSQLMTSHWLCRRRDAVIGYNNSAHEWNVWYAARVLHILNNSFILVSLQLCGPLKAHRHVAPFWNYGDSKATVVENRVPILHFLILVKLGEGWAITESIYQFGLEQTFDILLANRCEVI